MIAKSSGWWSRNGRWGWALIEGHRSDQQTLSMQNSIGIRYTASLRCIVKANESEGWPDEWSSEITPMAGRHKKWQDCQAEVCWVNRNDNTSRGRGENRRNIRLATFVSWNRASVQDCGLLRRLKSTRVPS